MRKPKKVTRSGSRITTAPALLEGNPAALRTIRGQVLKFQVNGVTVLVDARQLAAG